MAEWSNAAVLKTVDRSHGPGVRIPLPPPIKTIAPEGAFLFSDRCQTCLNNGKKRKMIRATARRLFLLKLPPNGITTEGSNPLPPPIKTIAPEETVVFPAFKNLLQSNYVNLDVFQEKCRSGRTGLTRNQLSRLFGTGGSNPSFSANKKKKVTWKVW